MLRSFGGLRVARAGVIALALGVAHAPPAGAQPNPIVFDGNLLWNNGPSGTTHYLGAAAAGSGCLGALDSTTTAIATVQYPNNSIADPLLAGAINDIANPNWRPAAGSPAFCGNAGHGKVVRVPSDGFFSQVPWVGAMGPTEQDWTQGWTYYSLDGAGRTDLGVGRPLVILANQNLYSSRSFSADSNYLVRGQLRVKSPATLAIPAGTVIFQETATAGTIVIERGAKIQAVGTAYAPIVITSDQAPGSQVPGGGGGLFIHGRARINAANSCAGDSAASEGGVVGHYGGNDDADDSGTLRYVRIEFAGVAVAPNNEANSFTFNGVGSGTQISHLQAHRGLDDLFEFFGGTAQARYLVATYGDDDGFDWQMGYRGKAQFVAIRQLAIQAGAERGIEADNNEFSNDTELCSGRSNPTLANFTILGDLRTGGTFPGVRSGVVLRRGTGGAILNSIISEWKTAGLDLQSAATFTNHCADRAFAVSPGISCQAGTNPNPIVFDGNLLFNNGPTGVENYVGAASAGSPCIPGLDSTTTAIATAQYTNNSIADPQLGGAIGNIANPDWRPALGGPAYAGNPGHGKTVNVPKDDFFEKVCHVGAVGADADWTQGWTYYSLDGAGRTDLGVGRPLVILANQNLYSNRSFSADSNYLVRGQLRVKSQARLTIPAGTVIFQETATAGTIIVERGGFISAVGAANAPIVITSDQAPGSQVPGGGGGLFIHGRARINAANSCAGDSAASEGGVVGHYGGNDDADSSGVLRYVRVEFAGVAVAPNNEANSFTFNGVGSRTQLEYLQAHRGLDDLFEFFGGTAQAKRLVATYGDDDGFDWQMGYRGKAQFVAVRQLAIQAGAERGIEADNNEFSNDTELCSGRSNPTLSNFTLIGDRRTGASFPGVRSGVVLRRGTGGTLINSIITEWKTAGLDLQSAATFNNHCADRAFAIAPGIQCSAGTVSVGDPLGRVFVAQGYPNPFRRTAAIRFALATAGPVSVDVYSASGRHVAQLAHGVYAAGEHTVNWTANRSLPSGVYFYKVRAAGNESTGKLVRVE